MSLAYKDITHLLIPRDSNVNCVLTIFGLSWREFLNIFIPSRFDGNL